MSPITQKIRAIKNLATDKKSRFIWKAKHGKLDDMPDEEYIKLMFKYRVGYEPDLENPKTFNEKIQWLKLNDRNPEYHQMVDKYEAKIYVAERIGEEHIIPTFGVWDRFEDIDFSLLPDRFVLKTTHDSGAIIICREKSVFNTEAAKEKLEKSMQRDLARYGREWSYMDLKPRILAEQYMEDTGKTAEAKGLTDYKFYCFNGEPKIIYVAQGLENHSNARRSFLTMDWEFAGFGRGQYIPFEKLPERPKKLDEMIEISKKLSAGLRFIRVDLYEINGDVYFGELTFYPASGFLPFKPEEWDRRIGDMLTL